MEEVRSFLAAITDGWSSDDKLNIRALGDGATANRLFRATEIDNAVEYAIQLNKAHNVYACINPARPISQAARDTDVRRARFIFVDADSGDAWKRVQEFDGPKPSILVQTGSTPEPRGHAYWRMDDWITSSEFKDAQAAMIEALGTDQAIKNPSRVMRIPGLMSWPNQKKRQSGYIAERVTLKLTDAPATNITRLIPAPKLVDIPAAQAQPVAPQLPAPASLDFDFGFQPAHDWDTLIAESRIEGRWHESALKLTSSAMRRGMSQSEFLSRFVGPLTQPGYSADQTRRELEIMLRSAAGKFPPHMPLPDLRVDVRHDDIADIEAGLVWADKMGAPEPAPYLIKGLLASNSLAMMYGASNSGKSFVALDMCAAISAGVPWFHKRVKPGGILYLAAEGEHGIRNRVFALRNKFQIPENRFAFRFADIDFLHNDQCAVRAAREVEAIERLGGIRPTLIVVDTLSQSMAGGNENDSTDMTAVIRQLQHLRRELQLTVLIVHHRGKNVEMGARGHSSLRAAVDTELEISMTEAGIRSITVTKQRDMPFSDPVVFHLQQVQIGVDEDGDEITTATVEAPTDDMIDAVQESEKAQPKGTNQIAIRDAFFQLRDSHAGRSNPGGTGFPPAGVYYCIEYEKLMDHTLGRMAGGKVAFQRSFDALLAIDYLCMNEGLVWISRREGKA